MRATVIGAVGGAALVLAASGLFSEGVPAFADRPLAAPDLTESLMAFPGSAGEGRQQLTIIDPRTRVVSVYHIDQASGEISLKSVRNITWDLQMTEFNGVRPLPQEIRSMSGKSRGEY